MCARLKQAAFFRNEHGEVAAAARHLPRISAPDLTKEEAAIGELPIQTELAQDQVFAAPRVRTRVAARVKPGLELRDVQLASGLLGQETGHQPNDPPFPVKALAQRSLVPDVTDRAYFEGRACI
jgi:hypothetical protein